LCGSKSENNPETNQLDGAVIEKASNSTAVNRNSHFSGKAENDEFKTLAASPETTDQAVELEQLDGILKKESSDFRQWPAHFMNIFLVGLALVTNLLRGSPKNPSILNISKCGAIDWSILGGFVLFASGVTYFTV